LVRSPLTHWKSKKFEQLANFVSCKKEVSPAQPGSAGILPAKIAQRSKNPFIQIRLARQAVLAGKMPALPGSPPHFRLIINIKNAQEDCKYTYETCVNGCPNEVCIHACKVAYDHCLACCDIACWP
jgi:hypothetical protein